MDGAMTVHGLWKGWGGQQTRARWAEGIDHVVTETGGDWGQKPEEKACGFTALQW